MELENVEDIYPLTPVQAGMLFHTASAPHSGVYVVQIRCLLSGNLNVEMFQAAWQSVLQRHAALRTAFLWEGLEEPLQVVRQHVDLRWEILDWSKTTEEERANRLEALLFTQRRAGLDLGDAPLMRMLLIRVDAARHRFVWTCHHLLVDGWSVAIVLDEVIRLYQARVEGKDCTLPAAASYRDFIAWQRSIDLEEASAFWREYLEGFVSRTSLRTPLVPMQSGEKPLHRMLETRISTAASASLLQSARQLRVTLNTVLHAAWALLLQRYSDENDVVFGTTVAGRPPDIPGIEQSVGLFINSFPVRVRVDDDQVFGNWLVSLQEGLLQVRQHEYTPLTRINEWSDMPRGETLFDTLLVLVNYPLQDPADDDPSRLKIVERDPVDQSNYPLAVLMVPAEALKLVLVYDPSVYSDETVTGILDHLQTLLSAMPGYLQRPLRELPILPDDAKQELLLTWNDTAVELPREKSVLDLISEQVARAPDAPALAFATRRLTYRELDSASYHLARCLIDHGLQAGDRVAIYLQRGPDLITGILAIMKAGGVYVPLDPDYPNARLEHMLLDSGAAQVLTSRELAAALPRPGARQVLLEEVTSSSGSDARHATLPGIDAEQPAYLIYTSGSTGNPKGVIVSHRNLLSSTLARQHYYQVPPSVFLLLSSVAFDSSVAGIFWTLTVGAELVVSEHRIEQDIGRLAACIEKHGVTHTLCLPSLYDLLLEHAAAERLASLRTVIVAGEAMPRRLLQQHRASLPGVALFNEYGPTEATVWCSVYDTSVHDPHLPVPIGKPVANARIYILDSQQRPLPVGIPGELYVGGDGVACGYWNNPEATAEKFVTVKPGTVEERLYRSGDLVRYLSDGNIEYLGRADRQMKLRGYRIEPAEIESALLRYPGIQQVVVLLGNKPDSGAAIKTGSAARLVAFLTTDPGLEVDSSTLRDYLERFLPAYMIPASFQMLDTMPLLPNGKVDTAALHGLPDEVADSGELLVEPRNSTERLLKDIWCDVLKLDSVSIHDNFFELGGDSILSIHLVSKANQQGLSLSPNDIFNFPTIARLGVRNRPAEAADRRVAQPDDAHDLTASLRDPTDQQNEEAASSMVAEATRHPLVLVHMPNKIASLIQDHMHWDQPVFILSAYWELADLDRHMTIEQLADKNIAELRALQPLGPYYLGGFSMGATIALEMAHRLRLAGDTVELLFLLDPPGPFASSHEKTSLLADPRDEQAQILTSQSPGSNAATSYPGGITANLLAARFRYISYRVLKPLRVFIRKRMIQPGAAGLAAVYRSCGLNIPMSLRDNYLRAVFIDAWRRYEFKAYDGPAIIFHACNTPGDKQLWKDITTGELTFECFQGRTHLEFSMDQELINQWTSRFARLLMNFQTNPSDSEADTAA